MIASGLMVAAALAADPAALLEDATGGGARVTLEGQRGAFDMSGERPRLVFSILAHNLLSVPVDAVEIGVLFAASEEALAGVDPSATYRAGVGNARVGVVRQRVEVVLAASGRAAVEVVAEPQPGQPDPQVFRTHVLGYHLAEVSAAGLLDLLGTEAGADEAAAVDTLALSGTGHEKAQVRARWGKKPGLAAGFASAVREPLPTKPALNDVLRRVYAVRALGVLGGDVAERTLKELVRSAELAPLDEALLVLLTARLVGSRLETPTAFAVPLAARRMTDVVAAALDDLVEPKDEVAEPTPVPILTGTSGDPTTVVHDPEPAGAGTEAATDSSLAPEVDGWVADGGQLAPVDGLPWPWIASGLLAALSLVSVFWWWRSNRRRG